MYELFQSFDFPVYWYFLPPLMVWMPREFFFLPVVLVSLVAAIGLWRLRRDGSSLREFLLPARIYQHPDARRDLLFALLNRTIYPLTVVIWVANLGDLLPTSFLAEQRAQAGIPTATWSVGWMVAYTTVYFLLRDLGFWVAHWMAHHIPLLWTFHQVHHTTRALNPASAYRQHPVDEVFTSTVTLSFATIGVIGFGVFFDNTDLALVTVFGAFLPEFAYNVLGTRHLQHSHVWLRYGPWLDRLLISPAHHQIHHSRARQHWDTNLGQTLAIWDWAFGTLYVPDEAECPLEFGVDEETDAKFSSLTAMYLIPFRETWTHLTASEPSQEPGAVPKPGA